jgi:dihydrofolate reductase
VPKYVASTTLDDATWNATVIRGDVAAEVARMKQEPGENILKFGTGELDRTVRDRGLVDEFHFWIFPVVAGAGPRLFDGLDLTHLALAGTTTFGSGIVVARYMPKESV